MRTVKTKDELKKAIEDGEKFINVESFKLFAACKLAASYNSKSALLKHYAVDDIKSVKGSVGEMECLTETGIVTIVITISILLTAIAILGILKGKRVIIEGEWKGGRGKIQIG